MLDEEEAYFFDTEDEANSKALDVCADIPESDRDKYTVSVGIVDEADLEEPGNWETFTQVEITSIFDLEE